MLPETSRAPSGRRQAIFACWARLGLCVSWSYPRRSQCALAHRYGALSPCAYCRAGTVTTTNAVEHGGYRPGSMAERLGSSSLRVPAQAYSDSASAAQYSASMAPYEPSYR